jgi:hypothetical protein
MVLYSRIETRQNHPVSAIRKKEEIRFLAEIEKLAKRIALRRLRPASKFYEAIGRSRFRDRMVVIVGV